MFCGTPDEQYWARIYLSTPTEIYFDERKSNYTFIRYTQKCFLDPTMRFHSQVPTKLKSTYKSLELTTATRLPTVVHHIPAKLHNVI